LESNKNRNGAQRNDGICRGDRLVNPVIAAFGFHSGFDFLMKKFSGESLYASPARQNPHFANYRYIKHVRQPNDRPAS